MKSREKKQETEEMAKLLDAGMNYRQIGDLHELSAPTVGQRLRRAGIAHVPDESRVARLDVDRLLHLYITEKLSLARIALDFAVSGWVIKKALKVYRIPKRRRPSAGGKHFDRLRTLAVGETLDINCPVKHPRVVLRSTARRLGIKIFIESVSEGLFRVTRIDPSENLITFQLARLNRPLLEELYGARESSISAIALAMNVPIRKIRQALEAFKIPKHRRSLGYGKYSSTFKEMKIGETVEMEYQRKRPHSSLPTIAARLGIKISMKKIRNGLFKITRVG